MRDGKRSLYVIGIGAKSSLLCWGLSQSGYYWLGEAGLEPKPEEPPLVGVWAPLDGRALCRKSPQRELKNSNDAVHIGGYRGGFAAAWAM